MGGVAGVVVGARPAGLGLLVPQVSRYAGKFYFEEVPAEMARIQDLKPLVADGDDGDKMAGVVMKADVNRIRGSRSLGGSVLAKMGNSWLGR